MLVVGIQHSWGELKRVLDFLAKKNLQGKMVAIELTFPVAELLDPANKEHIEADSEYRFWKRITEFMLAKGAQVIAADSQQRLNKMWDERDPDYDYRSEKFYRIAFSRTMHQVHVAEKAGASMLLTGFGHAKHIQQLLGKHAHVTIIAPPEMMRMSRGDLAADKRVLQRFSRVTPGRKARLQEILKATRRRPIRK